MQFCEWLQSKTTKAEPDAACQLLDIGEEFCKRISVLDLPLFETTDADTVKKFVRTVTNNKIFRIRNKKQHPAIVNAANWYYAFIRELPKLSLSTPEEEQKDNITEEKSNQDTHNSEFVPIGNFENDFYQWLRNVENMAIPTCRSYVSALHSAESFATEHGMETSISVKTDEPAKSLAVDFNGRIINCSSVDFQTWTVKISGLSADNNYQIRICPNGLFPEKEETIFVKRKGLIVDDDL